MLGVWTLRIQGILPESLDLVLFVSTVAVLFIGLIGEQQRFNRSLRRSGIDIAQLPPPFRWLRAPRFWWSLLTLAAVGMMIWIASVWKFGCYGFSPVGQIVRSGVLALMPITPSLLVQKFVFQRLGRFEKTLILIFFLILAYTIYSNLQSLCP